MKKEESLRERKKQETRDDIRRATLELTEKKGLEVVTIEEISEKAHISPRTFFNYFDSKEAALMEDHTKHITGLKEAILTAPKDEDIILVVEKALKTSMLQKHNANSRKKALKRHKLIEKNPQILRVHLVALSNLEKAVAEAIATRTKKNKKSPYPKLLAAISISILRLSFKTWVGEGIPPEKTLDTYFTALKKGF